MTMMTNMENRLMEAMRETKTTSNATLVRDLNETINANNTTINNRTDNLTTKSKGGIFNFIKKHFCFGSSISVSLPQSS
jgi:hypothetical protein